MISYILSLNSRTVIQISSISYSAFTSISLTSNAVIRIVNRENSPSPRSSVRETQSIKLFHHTFMSQSIPSVTTPSRQPRGICIFIALSFLLSVITLMFVMQCGKKLQPMHSMKAAMKVIITCFNCLAMPRNTRSSHHPENISTCHISIT